jgi:hypothetical protein
VLTKVDVEDFIDYQVAQLYLGNEDWPENNVKFWRLRTKAYAPNAPYGQDGRWRWFVYDLDFALRSGPAFDSLGRVLAEAPAVEAWSVVLLRRLLTSPVFKARFVERFAWHLEHTFAPERVLPLLDAAVEELRPEMPAQVARWGQPQSMEAWEMYLAQLRETLNQRPAAMRGFLARHLGPPPSGGPDAAQ